jgi:hypothetical protein
MREMERILTDAAVYSCRFDWETDKVLSFERIDLRSISRIQIDIALQGSGIHTESVCVAVTVDYDETDVGRLVGLRGSKRATTRFVAFKGLPLSNPAASPRLGPSAGTFECDESRRRTLATP